MSAPAAVRTPFVQGTPEWLEARLDGVTSSDAKVIAGEAGSVVELWGIKSHLVEPKPVDLATERRWRRGHLLEPVIAAMYTEQTGRPLKAVNQMRRHRQHPWAMASLDRESAVKGEKRLVELKSTASPFWDDTTPEGVPGDVFAQVQHQLWVVGYDVGDVSVLLPGFDCKIVELVRDDEYIGHLEALEREFWANVQSGTRPPVDGSEATTRVLNAMHARAISSSGWTTPPFLAPTPEMDEIALKLRDAIKASKDEALLRNTLKALLTGSSGVANPELGYRVTYAQNRPSVVTATNWQAVAGAFRQVCEALIASTPDVTWHDISERFPAINALWSSGAETDKALDAIESLHTTSGTREGAWVMRPTFKETPA